MLKFQPTLNSSRNLTAEREEKRKRKKKELNNFCVSHSFMNHSSRGQREHLFRKHRDYFIYERENYWDTVTRDLTPCQISWRYRSNLFDNFIGRLPARRQPTHAQRLCFQTWFVCFQTFDGANHVLNFVYDFGTFGSRLRNKTTHLFERFSASGEGKTPATWEKA